MQALIVQGRVGLEYSLWQPNNKRDHEQVAVRT